MADVILHGVRVLYRINKDKNDESLPLLSFRRDVFSVIFLKNSKEGRLSSSHSGIQNIPSDVSQLAQRRCDNVVTTSLLTLSQRCGTVENESCTDVSFRCCDNVALQRCQDVASTLLQRRHSIKHWITRSFYYGLFRFLSLHRNVKVTKVLSGKKRCIYK